MPDNRPRIVIVVASGRRVRFADHPAAWLQARLAARDDLVADVVDIRDFELDYYDAAVPPARAPRDYHGDAELERLGKAIDAADGIVLLTPEYNHGYPARLKNALDLLFAEFNRKAIGFVGYGNVGGARAIEQLRLVAVELEMASSRHSVNIFPPLMVAGRADGADPLLVFAELDAKLTLMLDDLVWWSRALSAARAAPSA